MNKVDPVSDLKKVFEIIESTENPRNKILLAIGFLTGLRISDILQLKISDLKGNEIVVQEQKTKNTRKNNEPMIKAITPELKAYIDKSLRECNRYNNDNEYVFISQKSLSKPMTREHAYRIVKDSCSRAGVKGSIGTHTMRKTAGTLLFKLTKSKEDVQLFLGHSNLKDTIRYLGLNKIHRDDLSILLSKQIKESGTK